MINDFILPRPGTIPRFVEPLRQSGHNRPPEATIPPDPEPGPDPRPVPEQDPTRGPTPDGQPSPDPSPEPTDPVQEPIPMKFG